MSSEPPTVSRMKRLVRIAPTVTPEPLTVSRMKRLVRIAPTVTPEPVAPLAAMKVHTAVLKRKKPVPVAEAEAAVAAADAEVKAAEAEVKVAGVKKILKGITMYYDRKTLKGKKIAKHIADRLDLISHNAYSVGDLTLQLYGMPILGSGHTADPDTSSIEKLLTEVAHPMGTVLKYKSYKLSYDGHYGATRTFPDEVVDDAIALYNKRRSLVSPDRPEVKVTGYNPIITPYLLFRLEKADQDAVLHDAAIWRKLAE